MLVPVIDARAESPTYENPRCATPLCLSSPPESASILHNARRSTPLSLTNPALTSLLLALTLAFTHPLFAQDNSSGQALPGTVSKPQPTAPTLHVYSRETILDVLVTDDKGQPVRGLTQSDFAVEEDGHPQPIRSFYEVDKTSPPAPARTRAHPPAQHLHQQPRHPRQRPGTDLLLRSPVRVQLPI